MTPLTRRLSVLALSLAAALCVLSAIAIYRNLHPGEEIEVYRAFLAATLRGERVPGAALLSAPTSCDIAPEDVMPPPPARPRVRGVSPALLETFFAANAESAEPINLKPLSEWANVVSLRDAKRIREKNFDFARLDGRTLIRFSRVGFDADKQQALFCIESPGMGQLVLLAKESGKWKVARLDVVWRS